jgi:hypothetical protein
MISPTTTVASGFVNPWSKGTSQETPGLSIFFNLYNVASARLVPSAVGFLWWLPVSSETGHPQSSSALQSVRVHCCKLACNFSDPHSNTLLTQHTDLLLFGQGSRIWASSMSAV